MPDRGDRVRALVRAAPVQHLADLLHAHPFAPLELAVSDPGFSLFIADRLVVRIPATPEGETTHD